MNYDLGRFDPPGLYPARPCRDEMASGLRAHKTKICEHGSGRTSNGVAITELSNATIFTDAGGNGLKHKTAWASAGDGVLFYDPDNLGTIEEKRQYVFTEWDPTATSDMEVHGLALYGVSGCAPNPGVGAIALGRPTHVNPAPGTRLWGAAW